MTLLSRARWARPLVLAALVVSGTAVPALAQTAAEMRDLPPDHWAYRAIQQLVERYGVMAGFPDQTFRGTKTVSRYELAAALLKVMQRIDQVGAGGKPTPGPAISAADRATLDRLKGEFNKELASLQERVKKQDDTLAELQTKIGKIVKVGGSIQTTIADDTLDQGKDRSAPYIATNFSLKFSGKYNDSTSYDASLSGAAKAGSSGDVPGPMGGGSGPSSDAINFRTARFTTKVGATTINVGRFPLWLVGFGPYSDQEFVDGNFAVGLGAIGPNAAGLRTGTDVGGAFETALGPVQFLGGLNSNILISQFGLTLGPVAIKAGYETDHKAITQNLLGTGARVKTTDNAAVVLDFGGEGPIGGSLQANLNNLNLTQYGGGLRGSVAGIDLNLVAMLFTPPDKAITVATFGGAAAFPSYALPWFGLKTPGLTLAALDNYTIDAPTRPDGKSTTGPGGQALGKNAGLSVNLNLENPWIPKLTAEYNVQAALIEGIFVPTPSVPITAEVILLRSTLSF